MLSISKIEPGDSMSKTKHKGPIVEPWVTPQMLDFEENSLKRFLVRFEKAGQGLKDRENMQGVIKTVRSTVFKMAEHLE